MIERRFLPPLSTTRARKKRMGLLREKGRLWGRGVLL